MKITAEGWAIVERDTHLGKWVEEHKRLDFDQNALPQMLPYIKGGVVLDIGANIGCYAAAFAAVADKVVCIEPSDEAFECLCKNMQMVRANNPNMNIDWYQCAVADSVFSCDVISDNDNVGMNYIRPVEKGKLRTVTIDWMEIENQMITGKSDYWIGFMKIDVEGYELHVLRGAGKTISIHKPVMVIEINDHTLKRTGVHRNEIFQWLTDHGYYYRNIYQNQGLQDDQLDIICFPVVNTQ